MVDFWVANEEEIAAHGHKMHDIEIVKSLVDADEEALKMYRH